MLSTRLRAAWVRFVLERLETLFFVRLPAIRSPWLLEPVLVLELLRQVLLGDEADPAARERLELELLPALHHLLDLVLPLLRLEPGVREHLLRARHVALVHLDGDVRGELVRQLVERRQPDEAGVG